MLNKSRPPNDYGKNGKIDLSHESGVAVGVGVAVASRVGGGVSVGISVGVAVAVGTKIGMAVGDGSGATSFGASTRNAAGLLSALI
jgi:hypothetical protein